MFNLINQLHVNHAQVNAAIKRYLIMFLKQDVSSLIEAMRYSILLGGKRLRPFLVYQIGKLFDIQSSNLDALAVAIECMHTYSLIHDDLPMMDNDTKRRGHPACHVKFGEATAILAGNALHTLAFTILAEAHIPTITYQNRLKMIATLASASGSNGMCLGQSLDLIAKHDKNTSNTQLETICQYKTGSLIRAAVRMGALAAGSKSYNILQLLDNYATAIGLAFQVQDDIIDILHDNKKWQEQYTPPKHYSKNNYPNISELNTAKTKAKNLYYQSLKYLKYIAKLGYNVQTLSEFSRYIIERSN